MRVYYISMYIYIYVYSRVINVGTKIVALIYDRTYDYHNVQKKNANYISPYNDYVSDLYPINRYHLAYYPFRF